PVLDHRRSGEVGEHDQRGCTGKGPRRDPKVLARDVRVEQGPSAGSGIVQPREATCPARPLCRRRDDPARGTATGLEAYASDLNPVAVLINKAMIEIPPKFAGRAPVGPLPKGEHGGSLGLQHEWPGATGLAEDVRRYGAWMRDEAQKRIGHL